MSRLRSLIQREKLRHLSAVEDDPHNTLAVMLLYAFLYGDRCVDHLASPQHPPARGSFTKPSKSEFVPSYFWMCSDGREEEAQIKDRLQNTVSRLETLPCADDSPEATSFWTNLLRTTFLEPAAGRVRTPLAIQGHTLSGIGFKPMIPSCVPILTQLLPLCILDPAGYARSAW